MSVNWQNDDEREKAMRDPYGRWRVTTPNALFLFRRLDEVRAEYECRVTELLAANNLEVEKRRLAEAEAERWRKALEDMIVDSSIYPIDSA